MSNCMCERCVKNIRNEAKKEDQLLKEVENDFKNIVDEVDIDNQGLGVIGDSETC